MKMNERMKKGLSFLLCALMLAQYVPTYAFAVTTAEDGLCAHHSSHTEACGYGEGQPCGYACAQCNEEDTGAQTGVAIPEGDLSDLSSRTSPQTGVAIPEGDAEAVCTCGTDDESIHATTCPVYVAPETAVCFCAEKCSEPNIWCDVCGFDYTQCGGTEGEVSATFDPEIYFTGMNVVDTEFSGDWYYDESTGIYICIILPDETTVNFPALQLVGKNLQYLETDNELLKVKSNIYVSKSNYYETDSIHPLEYIIEQGFVITGWSDMTDGSWSDYSYSNDGNTWSNVLRFEAKQAYSITVNASDNGTVTANEYAIEGETVTLNVSPADNYALDTLTVKDASGNNVTVENNSFTMPASAVTVSAIFAECDHSGSTHDTANDEGDGTHSFTCTVCNGSATEEHTMSSTTGNCQFCEAAMAEAKVTSGETDTYYETLKAALNEAKSGDTVTLCSDVDLGTTAHTIPADVTFCGGEYTVSGRGTGVVYNYGIIENGIFAFFVENEGTVNGGEFTDRLLNFGTVNGGNFVNIVCEPDSTLSGTVKIANSGVLHYMGECTIDLSNAVFGDGVKLYNGTEQDLSISSLHLPDDYAVAVNGNVVSVLPAYNEGPFVSHTHTYEAKNDATHHWTECACGKTTEKAEHSYTYTNDGDTHTAACSGCAYSKSEAHTADPTYTLTADGSQHIATYDCCGGSVTADHSFTDGICVCGAVSYDLWVGGVQFTSANLVIDSNDDSTISGTATYDPDTNTLTLDSFHYTGEGHERAAIYYGGSETLTLNLVGNSQVTCNSSAGAVYGIRVKGNLVVSGGGSLTAVGGTGDDLYDSEVMYYGVFVESYITVESGTLTGTGGNVSTSDNGWSYGVIAIGDITVKGGTLTGTGGSVSASGYACSYGVVTQGDDYRIVVESGTLTGTGGTVSASTYTESCGVASYSITLSGGVTVAKGDTQAFYQSPDTTDFANAVVWHGESDTAYNGTGTLISNAGTYYTSKYVRIAPCDHGGETPTYENGVCTVCGTRCNHTAAPTYTLTADGTQHVATYSCCGATVTEDHTTTTQATCSSKAICELCGEYGELAKDNHTGTLGTPVPTDDSQHTATYSCCGATVTDNHTGGTATCASGKICEACGVAYGSIDSYNHAGPYTARFTWVEPDEDGCFVYAELYCACDGLVDNSDGYAELKASAEAVDCKTPGYATYSITLTLNGEAYTDEKEFPVKSEDHPGFDSDGFCTLCGGYQRAVDTDGDGVYEIANAGQLYWYAQQLNEKNAEIHVKLTADILIPENAPNWVPINNGSVYLDGNYHTISGLKCIGDETTNYVGLIGRVWWVDISNLHITDSHFEGSGYVGAVAASTNAGGTITNCAVTNTTVTGGNYVGALVGYLDLGEVSNCYTDASTAIGRDWGDGTVSNVYYLSETDDGMGGKTADQFASGEVAYLLQSGVKGEVVDYNENGDPIYGEPAHVWGQTIGTDPYPVFGGKKVYRIDNTGCLSYGAYTYSNDEDTVYAPDHTFPEGSNGFCACGTYQPCEGAGTEADPYQIANAGNLYWFAQQVNSSNPTIHGRLTANIEVPTSKSQGGSIPDWTPIGKSSNKYTGTFDGAGHTISGLYFNNSSATHYAGLFGLVYSGGVVRNVGVIDSYFCGNGSVGGIAGYSAGTVMNCYNTGSVSGKTYVGGVVGINHSTVTDCYNTGSVTGSGYCVGSIAGYSVGTVTNCYYLTGCAKDGNGTTQNGIGTYDLGSTTADAEGVTTDKTTEEFASGEVAYLLNGSSSEVVWGQTIGSDPYPVLGGEKVYFDETADPQYYNEKLEIISVTITWGTMEFTYTDGEGWNNPDSAWVTVENTGSTEVTVTYTYETDRTDIQGHFYDGTETVTEVAIPSGESKTVWLILTGKPSTALNNTVIGTVKLTIE